MWRIGKADFYEPIQTCQQLAMDFIIRSRCDRRLADEAGHLWKELAQAAGHGPEHGAVASASWPGGADRDRANPRDAGGSGRSLAAGRLAARTARALGRGGAGSGRAGGSERTAALDFAHLTAVRQLGGGPARGRAVYCAVVDRDVPDATYKNRLVPPQGPYSDHDTLEGARQKGARRKYRPALR